LVLSGSVKFYEFFLASLIHSSRFSETMMSHVPPATTDLRYIGGLIFCGAFWVASLGVAASDRVAKGYWWPIAISGALTSFLLFKVGFVRLDAVHTSLVYCTLLPVLALMGAILSGAVDSRVVTERLLVLGMVVALFLSFMELRFYGISLPVAVGNFASRWLEIPAAYSRGIRLLTGGFSGERRREAALNKEYPHLFNIIQRSRNSFPGKQPLIAFLPAELMFAHCTPGFKFSPIPSLQLYLELCTWRSRSLVQDYLKGDLRPDVIVLGEKVIDGRNSLSELSNWIGPLCRDYDYVAEADGYSVLERHKNSGHRRTIVPKEQGPGLFLQARTKPLTGARAWLFPLVTTLFKAPELKMQIHYRDASGTERSLTCRCYRSQLEQGCFVGNLSLSRLLKLLQGKDMPLPSELMTEVLDARAFREVARRNLDVFPEKVELETKFCTVEEAVTQ
jgi:hypothetical protein